MAVPGFLNSSFKFVTITGVDDVQDIIDQFETEVLANSPVWTKVSTGLFKSPVDAAGRWFDVLLTRVSQYVLEARLRDESGVAVSTRRLQISSANTNEVDIYTGEFHYCIDAIRLSAASEYLAGGMLDLSPKAQNAHTHYHWANGTRNNSSSDDGSNTTAYASMIDNVTATLVSRCSVYCNYQNSYVGLYSPSANRIYRPRLFLCVPTGGGNLKYAGRQYHALGGVDGLPQRADVQIPLDTGTTGVFRRISQPSRRNFALLLRKE